MNKAHTNIPLVSVIIPTYNRTSLRGAVASVLGQTYKNLEIIVVDDCSPRPASEILAGIDDQRLRVVRQEANKHTGAARNRGVRESKGDIIAFLDDDDLWMPEKLQRQVGAIVKEGCVASIVQYFTRAAGEYVYKRMAFGSHVPGWAKVSHGLLVGSGLVIRKDKFLEVGYFEEHLPRIEDWEWSLRARSIPIKFIGEPLLYYAGYHSAGLMREMPYVWAVWQMHKDRLKRDDPGGRRDLRMRILLRDTRVEIEHGKPLAAVATAAQSFATSPLGFMHYAAYYARRSTSILPPLTPDSIESIGEYRPQPLPA